MNPQERQLVDELFNRLAKLETAPRDPDGSAAIAEGLRKAPNAVYPLVQTVLLQDEALKRANARIEELEAAQAPPQQQPQSGSFLDSMRSAVLGQGNRPQPHGSVPNVPPPESRPVWNSGQAMQSAQPGGYGQAGYGQPPLGPSYGAPPFGGGGGSFLGTAAAAAAGAVGGSLLLGGIRNMMGGSHHGFAEPATAVDRQSPWSDQSDSALARDAGIDDIGSREAASDHSRSGLFDPAGDQSSNDDYQDTDDFGDDGDDFSGGDDSGGDDFA